MLFAKYAFTTIMEVRFLDFEKQVAELEKRISDLRGLSNTKEVNITSEINKLEQKAQNMLKKIYKDLTPWQKVQVARHEERPQFLDYVKEMAGDFEFFAGDRTFAEDLALLGGVGHFYGRPVVVIGQQKGNSTESRLAHNFGMARPEGYRKAQRLIGLADKFGLPIVTFVNTSGAYPGIESEERGQSAAIASCTLACVRANVPIISVIIGEGGSGGAVAIATANYVMMLEHSFYSVISPEGCASILWKTAKANASAAAEQKLTAQDLYRLRIIDEILPEPVGGAHRDKAAAIKIVLDAIDRQLARFQPGEEANFKRDRAARFLKFGEKEAG
ncbi:MAG: acetyl-CoA carboxylase carboxyltransferase subunit alpha [Holosporales bacterium]|jgi:acetyl-CoA carboxylase carboxyl transferase subunit alpha|nr:acetyl-CoA carboxylase carboxyltransferase subunit alpha [Holosporales bacterium]